MFYPLLWFCWYLRCSCATASAAICPCDLWLGARPFQVHLIKGTLLRLTKVSLHRRHHMSWQSVQVCRISRHNWWEGFLVRKVGVMFPYSYLQNKACTQFLIFELLKPRSVALIVIDFDTTGVSNWVSIRHPFLTPPCAMIHTSFPGYLQEMAHNILHHLELKGSQQWVSY